MGGESYCLHPWDARGLLEDPIMKLSRALDFEAACSGVEAHQQESRRVVARVDLLRVPEALEKERRANQRDETQGHLPTHEQLTQPPVRRARRIRRPPANEAM